ncbi:hypothetical protein ACFODT_02535 [Vibrio zhugei]|uniref:Uncharacterized protein n=1 Tax=Vibrio zhugei TaxID=2479546 RepID=A0ABV7C6C1_9VIBR|nr:hypothetical protein [Vibrio zhugei]
MAFYDIFDKETLYQCPIGYNPETCSCASCVMTREWHESDAQLQKVIKQNVASTGASITSIHTPPSSEPVRASVKERLQAQRIANLEESDKAFAAAQSRTVKMSRSNMYWPPYNPLAPNGEKIINVDYVSEVTSIAVLSLAEAQEFYENLSVKQNISDTKAYKNLGEGIIDAISTAKGLGGLGVESRIKNINGVDWIIINNFRRHKQTLMKGNKWLANNPRVVEAAIGLTEIKGAITYIKANPGCEVAFSIGINAADYILRDEATLTELGVNSAGDIVKGMTATVVAGALAVVGSGGSVLFAGAIFAFASWAIGQLLDKLDESYGLSSEITNKLEALAQ